MPFFTSKIRETKSDYSCIVFLTAEQELEIPPSRSSSKVYNEEL